MDSAARESIKTFNCFSCGIDCTKSRFHYAKSDPPAGTNPIEQKYDLCPNCYFQSRMPSNHRSSDFVKMEEPAYSHIPDKDAPWTDSETLLLLEGLEAFDNDWSEVSKHVGTRTREECVLKFLSLDIQDQYLEDGALNGSATMKALTGRSPISQLDNPVMSVVSFLAQMADPEVVAAASNRSIAVMQKQLRAQLEKGMGGSEQETSKAPEKEKESVKAEDQMEVDSTEQSTEKPEAEINGSANVINDIASTALATTAARGSGLASHEEREITRMVSAAVNLTLQKFELKMAQFAEMEEIVQAERRDLEKGRQQLFLDRLSFKKRMKDMEDTFRKASLKDPQEGMRMMQEAVGATSGQRFGFQSEVDGDGNSVMVTPESGDGRNMDL
jgi:SWI/SNF related-matrix-associated actin-dependent regulator of chromatin subfamily C